MKEILYHGSDKIIKKPMYGVGKNDNDYGSGFYTTKDIVKAKEWAIANGTDKAVCNAYELDTSGLVILNLDSCGTLAWIAEVTCHRGAKVGITDEIGARLVEKYKVDTSNADIIIGYRADDSYITVVEAFLKNEISVDEVDKLFRKGNLGQQVFIKSQKAFDSLTFIGFEEVKRQHGSTFGDADVQARREVFNYLNKRERAIQIEGFAPTGITARDAINNDFEYSREYLCYMPAVKEELSKNEAKASPKSKSSTKKKGEKYEPDR